MAVLYSFSALPLRSLSTILDHTCKLHAMAIATNALRCPALIELDVIGSMVPETAITRSNRVYPVTSQCPLFFLPPVSECE